MGIGDRLRATREARGLSLEEAAAQTRIKRAYLEALEREAFSLLPSPAHARGFLRRYARWLGLDAEALLPEWDGVPTALQTARPSAMPSMFELAPIPARPAVPWRRLAALGVALLVLAGLFGVVRTRWLPRPGALPPSPTGGALGGVARPTNTPLPMVGAPPLRLEVTAAEHVWVRIFADGQVVYQGLLRPEETRTWEARSAIGLETGNAAALQVSLNGRPEAPLGGRGEIVRKTWSRPP